MLKRRLHSIFNIVTLSFLPFWACFFFRMCLTMWLDSLCMVLKHVHMVKWLRCCSHVLCNSCFAICCDHACILCYDCNLLSGIVLQIADSPETLHRSGCFNSHIWIYIFSWLCIIYFFTWSSHLLLLCGRRG